MDDYVQILDEADHSKLPPTPVKRTLKPQSVPSLALHFALSAIGPGFLTLPYAVSRAGLPLALFFLLLSAWLSARAALILAQAKIDARSWSDRALPTTCPTTMPDLVRRVLGRGWAEICEGIIIFNGFGVAISFLIFLADFAGPPLRDLGHQWLPGVWSEVIFGRSMIVITSGLLCTILASVSDLSGLMWLSALPVTGLSIASLCICHMVISDTSFPMLTDTLWALLTVKPAFRVVETLNIFLFALMMHSNVIPLIKDSPNMRRDSLILSISLSHGGLLMFYTLISLAGCIVVGDHSDILTVSQNFTLNLPAHRAPVLLLRIVLSLTLLGVAPYQFTAISTSMVEFWRRKRRSSPGVDPRIRRRTLTIASIILIGMSTFCALLTDQVATLLSIVGGLGTTTLMCALPALLRSRYTTRRLDNKALLITAQSSTSLTSTTSSNPTVVSRTDEAGSTWSKLDFRYTTALLWVVGMVGYSGTAVVILAKLFRH